MKPSPKTSALRERLEEKYRTAFEAKRVALEEKHTAALVALDKRHYEGYRTKINAIDSEYQTAIINNQRTQAARYAGQITALKARVAVLEDEMEESGLAKDV